MDLLIIFIPISIGVTGHLFLKKGMMRRGKMEFHPIRIFRVFADVFMAIGTFFFVFSSMLWLIVLSKFDLSFAYPMVSISFVLIPIGSKMWFKEEINRIRWIGIAVICLGVILITRS